MNNTDPNIHLGQALKQNAELRTRLELTRANMSALLTGTQREIRKIDESLKVTYTGWTVILKKNGDQWVCVGCVDTNNLPDDLPEDFDAALPIPNPETLPDFEGW